MDFTTCDKWLNTVSDTDLDNYSQAGLAREAWNRGAAHTAREILKYLDGIDTARLTRDVATIGRARVIADEIISAASAEARK